ncbi:MAG: Gfo/Idh/MocA family oxidoreductase, partial [Anaerolineales bacterium]|nr:Gfo/Idh/MocA family oxidoreductase [Anaerolineales bacterium]
MAVSLAQADAMLAAVRQSGRRLMVGYMKRYDAGNDLVKAQVDAFRVSGEVGRLTYARNHGFGGNWTANLDTSMETTDELMPPAPQAAPGWLPPEYQTRYVNSLQQYCHNVNLLRWLLDAGDRVTVQHVTLDDDGYMGVVVFDMNGTRAVLESGRLSHFRWDEHTQIYFEHGWVRTWAPPLLLRLVPAEVEIYRAGKVQTFTRPVPPPAWSWSYRREAEHFIECLQTGAPFRSSAEDTRTDVRLFEDIYRAYLTERGAL